MLVWNAIPSITPMMSAIFLDDALISFIVETTCETTLPPREATVEADDARSLAWWALEALDCTVSVSWCMRAVVRSSDAACISVRSDRSWLPDAISCAAERMRLEPLRTSPTMAASPLDMSRTAASRLLPAPDCTWMSCDRSPAAMRRITSRAYSGSPPSWRQTLPMTKYEPTPRPTTTSSALASVAYRLLETPPCAPLRPESKLLRAPSRIVFRVDSSAFCAPCIAATAAAWSPVLVPRNICAVSLEAAKYASNSLPRLSPASALPGMALMPAMVLRITAALSVASSRRFLSPSATAPWMVAPSASSCDANCVVASR